MVKTKEKNYKNPTAFLLKVLNDLVSHPVMKIDSLLKGNEHRPHCLPASGASRESSYRRGGEW